MLSRGKGKHETCQFVINDREGAKCNPPMVGKVIGDP
jgi:hypothetical protein